MSIWTLSLLVFVPVLSPPALANDQVRVTQTQSGVVALNGPLGASVTEIAVLPGEYRVQWTSGDQSNERSVTILADQVVAIPEANLALRGTVWILPRPRNTDLAPAGKRDTAARAEIVLFQTLHGIAVGAESCAVGRCEDGRVWALVPTLGAGLGLSASLYFSRDGITSGETLAIDSATAWGFWHGLAIVSSSSYFTDDSRRVAGAFLTGQLLGLGAGISLATLVSPQVGTVALTNSFGIWAGVVTALGHAAAQTSDSATVWLSVLAASDLGLAAGVFANQQIDMSRGRTLVIDAGGILGLLGGMGSARMLNVTTDSPKTFFGAAIAGTLIGLGTTAYLTQGWDVPEIPAQVMVVPFHGGAMATVGLNI